MPIAFLGVSPEQGFVEKVTISIFSDAPPAFRGCPGNTLPWRGVRKATRGQLTAEAMVRSGFPVLITLGFAPKPPSFLWPLLESESHGLFPSLFNPLLRALFTQ